MDILTNHDELIDIIKNSNKIFGRIGFVNVCRWGQMPILNGHPRRNNLYSEAKKHCDVLIGDYIEFTHSAYYIAAGIPATPVNYSFETIYNMISDNTDIDYFIKTPMTDSMLKNIYDNIECYNKALAWCGNLGLPNIFSLIVSTQALCNTISYPLRQITKSFVDPRGILCNLISQKYNTVYRPIFLWNFFRELPACQGTEIILLKIINIMADKIKAGISSYAELYKCMYEYYLEKPKLVLLDMNTLEKIDHINANCIMILQNLNNAELFYIKDDNLIY
jgi:hypothetical protein